MADAKLIANVQDHLNRLVSQLNDIEESRKLLDEAEYSEMKKESMDQLKELERTLCRMQCGNISLKDELDATRSALRAAINESFSTPEIVAMFAKRKPALLRQKLLQFDAEYRTRKLSFDAYKQRKTEILFALDHLKDKLSTEEEQFLSTHSAIPRSILEPTNQLDTID